MLSKDRKKIFSLITALLLLFSQFFVLPIITPAFAQESCVAVLPVQGYYSTYKNQIIDYQGHAVHLSTVNWFGFSNRGVPLGVEARSYKEMMNEIKSLGFDSIRLTFDTNSFYPDEEPDLWIDPDKNPDLVGLSSVEVLDKFVEYAGQIDLKIILAHYKPSWESDVDDLWYDATYSNQDYVDTWKSLATRYQGNSTIIGVDLYNEPFGRATWGDGGATDWHLAATQTATAIQQIEPNWLIIVQGLSWGKDLSGVADFPVTLPVSNKVVYSPHIYPYSVTQWSGDNEQGFEDGLHQRWNDLFGYIYQQELAPVWIGEFGSKFEIEADLLWLDELEIYLKGDYDGDGTLDFDATAAQVPISWGYWEYGPHSTDTGGIVQTDWVTLEQQKINYLQPLVHPDSTASCLDSTTPEPSPSPDLACSIADINVDRRVNLADYSILSRDFFSDSPSNPRSDINQSGRVDLSDYSILASEFFSEC